jgi:NADH-quinone oxidoreductase subunit L
MGGLRRFLPGTALGFTIATLAIAGVPPLAGFWAKDDAISSAFFGHDYGVYVVGLVAAVLTAVYMMREVLLVFYGNERFHPAVDARQGIEADPAGVGAEAASQTVPGEAEAEHHERDLTVSPTVDYGDPVVSPPAEGEPHEGAGVMVAPVLVLAFLAIVGGLLDLPFQKLEFLTHFLDPVFEVVAAPEPTSFWSAFGLDVVAICVALGGIFIAWRIYRGGLEDPAVDPLDRRLGTAGRLFGHAWYYEEGIAAAVGGPIRNGARWLADVFDGKIIDGAVNGIARGFGVAGTQIRKVQTGLVRQYALAIAAGTVALLVWAVVRAS